MINIGIIGFGSMGKMLTNGFLLLDIIPQENLFIFSRTLSKVEIIKEQYKAVQICNTNLEVVKNSDIIFICTPPNQVKSVLLEISGVMTQTKYIVSIAAYISLDNIESIIKGQISKVIPSFVSEVNEGVFLVCHNKNVIKSNKDQLNKIISKLGIIYEINESQFEIYTDITSCSPGIFSSIFSEFLKSACKHGDINGNDALEMFIQTLYGLSKIYKERHIDFNETIKRVARKGGITEIGISVVNDKAPALFDDIFEKTLAKHEIRKQEFVKEFS